MLGDGHLRGLLRRDRLKLKMWYHVDLGAARAEQYLMMDVTLVLDKLMCRAMLELYT